jgi:2-C-methyl-D-erythritol 4-phosphate cytidylyltransferase
VDEAVGVVPLEGRGDLPLVDLHGEPAFVHPVRALRRAGVEPVVVTAVPAQHAAVRAAVRRAGLDVDVVDGSAWWAAIQDRPVVLADPLCPLVPWDFVARVVDQAPEGVAVAAYRPVTDTVKILVAERVTGTLDRDTLAVVVSPVLLPARLPGDRPPPVRDAAALVGWLRERGRVELVEAPPMARRVGDESALRVLEGLDDLGRPAPGT